MQIPGEGGPAAIDHGEHEDSGGRDRRIAGRDDGAQAMCTGPGAR